MPCSSQGSRSDLSVGIQANFDSVATSFANLPYTTQSLNLTKDRVIGTDLQSDRQTRVDRHGNRQVGGDIVCDLRQTDFDTLIRSAMLNDWTNVSGVESISIGTDPVWLSFQDIARDLTDITRTFVGCSVSTMAISLAPNQMVTTTFGIVGQNMSIDSAPDTPSAASTKVPFDSYSGSISIGDADGSLSVSNVVTSVDFTLTNSFGPTFTIGNDLSNCLEYGRAEVEGTITTFFENADEINRFVNETESALKISVSEPGGAATYTFDMPRVKINSADGPVDGPGSRIITFSFVAIKPKTGTTSMLTITRNDTRDSDSKLSGLTTSLPTSSPLMPSFDPGQTSYTQQTPFALKTVSVTPSVLNNTLSKITVGVRGQAAESVTSGQPSTPITLTDGANTPIDIIVTAADGTTTTYDYIVSRVAASSTSTLRSIDFHSGDAGFEHTVPSPTPNYPQGTQDFTAVGFAGVRQCKFTLIPQDGNATMTLNGNLAESNVEYTVAYGPLENTIPFTCTAEDGTTRSLFNLIITGQGVDEDPTLTIEEDTNTSSHKKQHKSKK